MTLSKFEVIDQADIDGVVTIKADDGKVRIVANISRSAIDDYFQCKDLDKKQYADLIRENIDLLKGIMIGQYEQGQSRTEKRFGSNIQVIDIDSID